MSIQLIDWVKGERELRDKEGRWIYKLGTLLLHGLNDNDGFYAQNKKTRNERERALMNVMQRNTFTLYSVEDH